MGTESPELKPLLRGHFHQAAFFVALGACSVLLARLPSSQFLPALLVYSGTLIALFGISALYHRPHWGERQRKWMRRLDHSAIFLLIAGTGTPLFLLALPEDIGRKVLVLTWTAAGAGILQTLFWAQAPKWLTGLLAVIVGWLAIPYVPLISVALGPGSAFLLVAGGVIYTLGALTYALKRPNPLPAVFGYHEIFHLLVIIAAILHFIVIARLTQLES